jgi:adenylate cyclase class 2
VLEVEVKYRVPDPAALRARVEAVAAPAEERADEDHYHAAPDRDFARTDEAVRLRRVGDRNYLTYKGPKREAATKTRPEVEIPLGDGPAVAADALRFLAGLGYRPVAVVRKSRRVYTLDRGGFPVTVSLDEVAGVGHFAEVEVVTDESRFEAARAVVLGLAAELGLADQERRSYLELVLAAGRAG